MRNFNVSWLIFILMVFSIVLMGCSSDNQEGATLESPAEPDESIETHPVEVIGSGEYKFPDQYVEIKNPIPADEASITKGQEIYQASCERCHGETGMGDGTSAIQNDLAIINFSDEKISALSDGELFYIVSNGVEETAMVGWDMFNEDLRWHLVNYIRVLQQD